jgi:hypothetical protein
MSVTLGGTVWCLGGEKMDTTVQSSLVPSEGKARAAIDLAHSQFCKTRGIEPSQDSIERFANHRTEYNTRAYEGKTRQQLVMLLRDRLPD